MSHLEEYKANSTSQISEAQAETEKREERLRAMVTKVGLKLCLCRSTACRHRMAHMKWKETKLQPSMLPGSVVPGSLLSFFPFPLGHPMSAGCILSGPG